jgi:hypothetical protein
LLLGFRLFGEEALKLRVQPCAPEHAHEESRGIKAELAGLCLDMRQVGGRSSVDFSF